MRPITAWLLLLANLMLLASAPGQTSALPAQGTSALAGDAGHGLAVFDSLCKSLEDNYPMLELVGWRNEWIEEFRERIARADHDEARFELMEELVCRLNDYHTRLSWPGRPRLTRPPVLVEPVLTRAELPPPYGIWGQVHPPLELPPLDDVAIAVVEAERSCGLQAGRWCAGPGSAGPCLAAFGLLVRGGETARRCGGDVTRRAGQAGMPGHPPKF